MKNNPNIEEVFKTAFENFEADVNPAAWTNIEAGINKSASVEKGSKGSNVTKWTVAAAILAMALLGTWYFSSNEITVPAIDKKDSNAVVSEEKSVAYNEPAAEKKAAEPAVIVKKEEPAKPAVAEKKTVPSSKETIGEIPSKNPVEIKENPSRPETISKEIPAVNTAVAETKVPAEKEIKAAETKTSAEIKVKKPENKNDYVGWADYTQELTAVIEATPMEGPSPLMVSFFNINFGKAKTHLWDFGDGNKDSSGYKLTHTYNEPGMYRVVLTVKSESGKTYTTSTVINVDKTSKLDFAKVAKVFSPNNDGENDRFCIEGESIKTMNVAIVDVKEQILYSWDRPGVCWDGRKYDGELLPEGIYYWICNATGADGKVFVKKGEIRLVR